MGMVDKVNRRSFLKGSFKGAIGLLTISVIPLGLVACSDDSIDTSSMANLGPLDELKKGPFPKKVNYKVKVKDAWVEQELEGFVYLNVENRDLLIMSPICTHLGCTAGNAEEAKQKDGVAFYCPCHGGEYDQYGVNIGGPPPRPLDLFEPYLIDGNVHIPILSPQERKKI